MDGVLNFFGVKTRKRRRAHKPKIQHVENYISEPIIPLPHIAQRTGVHPGLLPFFARNPEEMPRTLLPSNYTIIRSITPPVEYSPSKWKRKMRTRKPTNSSPLSRTRI